MQRSDDQRIIDLYDEYTHAPLPRRVFIERLAGLCGSTAAAMALLPLLDNNYANAATGPERDRLSVEYPQFEKVEWHGEVTVWQEWRLVANVLHLPVIASAGGACSMRSKTARTSSASIDSINAMASRTGVTVPCTNSSSTARSMAA